MHKSLIQQLPGDQLALEAYLADFRQRFWKTDRSGCWKIERQQEFTEPGVDSWEAFAKGDWRGALRLMESRRRDFTQYYKRIQKSGFDVRRVRVAQEPFSPYLLWELNILHIRHQCGAKIRVVDAAQVQPFENSGILPEIFILGRSTAYQVLYGEGGAAEGAIRTTDKAIIEQWIEVAKNLYAAGEELDRYFQRKVAGLRPPNVT